MHMKTAFNPELIQRYDGIGPRYTSYPTAPQFHTRFGNTEFLEALRDSNEDSIPRSLSLYAHIPFCFSPCFYCGCHRIITRDNARKQDYLDTLLKEIQRISEAVDDDREAVQLHLGGGTPNALSTDQLAQLMRQFERCFRFAAPGQRDFSIEVDPRTVTEADVFELQAMGFNRISLGIQDFDPQVQAAINRLQDTDQIGALTQACRSAGFHSVNFDLIYGLPLQNRTSFQDTLNTVSRFRPDRIALYSYAHMPTLFKAQKQISVTQLPNPALKLELFQCAVEHLIAEGYVYIGMDHFALPEDELARAQRNGDLHRNFMGYTTRKQTDLLGFGVSAISQVADCYAQNAKDIPSWAASIEHGMTAIVRGLTTTLDDRIRAEVIQQLMCQGRVCFAAVERRFGIQFHDYFRDALSELEPLVEDGLLTVEDGILQVLPNGHLLLRVIASRFDAYLPKQTSPGLLQLKVQ